jgi:hypothetical protein
MKHLPLARTLVPCQRQAKAMLLAFLATVAALATSGCVSTRASEDELKAFAASYTYLEPESDVNLFQYISWQRVFTGKWGAPIVVSLDQGGWTRLKGPPETETTLRTYTDEYSVRVTVDLQGVRHVFHEGTSLQANIPDQRLAMERTALQALKRIHTLAIEHGIIAPPR